MKFSIVTVVKNNPGIVEALQSIVNQRTDSPVEIIVIDGLSTDDTLERVREFGVRISTLVSERDKGIYDAMNKGLFRATGDVVGFLNSDDTYIDETVLESVDLAFRANPEAQAVYGDIIYTSSKVPGKVVRYWRAGGSVADITRSGWVPPHPGFFARRECLVNSGGFDPSYTIAGDFDLILRLLIKENVKAVYIRKQLVNMKLGGISNRSIGAILKANKEIIRAFRKCQIRLPLSYFPAKILNRLCQFLE